MDFPHTQRRLVVDSVVVCQILYSNVTEHPSEYATLKTRRDPDRFPFGTVIRDSLILFILGFLSGLVVSQVVYVIAYRARLLPLTVDSVQIAIVYLLTAAMCIFSGALAMRRLRMADQAKIF